jgi:YgiT-type zinc finger domain-containing protein
MARKRQSCASRDGMTRFEDKTFTIEHAGMTAKVEGLSGWRCAACEEVEFDAESALRYAAASNQLVLRDRARQSEKSAASASNSASPRLQPRASPGAVTMRFRVMSEAKRRHCQP